MYLSKIILGTVQFGLQYGIANTSGQVQKEEIPQILATACNAGIDTLDTAYLYGESEQLLGQYIHDPGCSFKVISKLPDLTTSDEKNIRTLFQASLFRLQVNNLYGYMVHSFSNFIDYPDLNSELVALKQEGLIQKIGVSLYNPKELQWILDNNIDFDFVQIPYNILDQRFEFHFSYLQEQKKEIHARSVFLQGMFFLDEEKIRIKFPSVVENIMQIRKIAAEINIQINALCMGFVLLNPYIDKMLIGIDSLHQLQKNIEMAPFFDKVEPCLNRLKELRSDDEQVILPYNWQI